jgi:hypothetical protein
MKTIIYTLIFQVICALSIINAQTTVFTENFSGFTRTDVTVNNRAKIMKTDGVTALPGWIICSGARQEAGAFKLGQGSTIGYVTTPKLNLSGGAITVTIHGAQYVKPAVTPPATFKVAILVDGAKVGEVNVGMAWRDVNTTNPFNVYTVTDIPAATANSRVTIEVGNTSNGGTAGNSIILDQVEVAVNGSSVMVETFNNFTLGYSWTWNQTWDGATTYTNNSPTDLFPFVIGELTTELDARTQAPGWKGKAIFEKGGMAVIGWERQYNAATTSPDYAGYLTTPPITYQTGDVLTYTVGTNVGLVGTPSAPTMEVLLGEISSSTVIGTPTLPGSTSTPDATSYTYTFTEGGTSPVTFKLGGTTTKDEALLTLVKVERSTTTINNETENSISVFTIGNELIINNTDAMQELSIYSYNGMLIITLDIEPGQNRLNINKGVYLLKLKSGITKKVVV